MEQLAEQAESILKEEVGVEVMIGVSYYDEEGIGHVFRSDWAEEKYDPEQVNEIVEELRFEALNHVVHEERQEETLHATVRIYDEMLDVAVPTNGTRGVAFALDLDGDFSIRELVSVVEENLGDVETDTPFSDS